MFAQHTCPEQLKSIISKINSLKPIKNSIPAKWENIFAELSGFLQEYQNECNNDQLIYSIVNFASNFDCETTQEIFSNCIQINIGYYSSLFCSSVALEFERIKNYITSLDIYEISIQREAQPIGFLYQTFDSFKERMLKRLYGNYSLDLGVLENNVYTFIDGGITCKSIDSNLPQLPKYDFLEVINFDPSKAAEYTSPQSFSKSRSSFISKPSNYQQNSNLSPPHFEQVEFPANNSFHDKSQSSFLSPTSQPQAHTSFSQNNQQIFNPQEKEFEVNDFFQPQQNSNNNDQSQTELSFQFNHVEPKRSILKKKSPSPSRNNSSGVKFNNRAQPANDKKRASTPVGKNNKLEVGAKIFADIFEFHIERQIGSGAFIASAVSEEQKFVIKRIPMNYTRFTPKFPFLFSLPIESINNFYVTHFSKIGTFDSIISCIHSSRVDENVALFYLLQLLLMIDDLETKFMAHGNICPQKLLNKYPKCELPTSFNINDPVWQDVGICLCSCDEIHYDEGIEDRKAVAKLFHFIAKKTAIDDDFETPPPRWNNEIWVTTFRILQTKDPLASLIELIHGQIQKNPMKLRSQISRIYAKIV